MPIIKYNNGNQAAIYKGSTPFGKVFKGNTLVWWKAPFKIHGVSCDVDVAYAPTYTDNGFISIKALSSVPNSNYIATNMSPDGKHIAFLGSSYATGLYFSHDYGVTFTNVSLAPSTGSPLGLAMSYNGQHIAYSVVFGVEPGLYVSHDYGSSFTKTSSVSKWYDIAMSGDGKYVVIGGLYNNIYVSSDYGHNFVATATPGNIAGRNFVNADGSLMLAAVRGTNIYRSTDYGGTWTPISVAPTVNDLTAIIADYTGQYCMVGSANSPYGLQFSTDYGVTFGAEIVSPVTTALLGGAISTDNKIIKIIGQASYDGGTTFHAVGTGSVRGDAAISNILYEEIPDPADDYPKTLLEIVVQGNPGVNTDPTFYVDNVANLRVTMGDGTTYDADSTIIHQYADTSLYTITVIALDTMTCSGYDVQTDLVQSINVIDLEDDGTGMYLYANNNNDLSSITFDSCVGRLDYLEMDNMPSLTSVDLSWVLGMDGTARINFYNCTSLDTITLPPYPINPETGLKYLSLVNTALTGALDLTCFSKYETMVLGLTGLDVTSILFNSSATATGSQSISINNNPLLTTLDVSIFNDWNSANSTNALYLYNNPLLTTLTLPSAGQVNYVNYFQVYNTAISTLDLSNISFSPSGTGNDSDIYFHTCPNLTSVTFNTTDTTQGVTEIYGYLCPNLAGTLDLSGFVAVNRLNFRVYGCQITGVTFNASVTGSLNQFNISNTDITSLDLSKFTELYSAAALTFNGCTSLTSFTQASTNATVGYMGSLDCNGCTSLTTLDLSNYDRLNPSASSGSNWRIYDCTSLTSLTFPTVVDGNIYYLYAYNCDLTGTIDISGFTGLYRAQIGFWDNPNMTSLTMANPTVHNSSGDIWELRANDCGLTGTVDIPYTHYQYAANIQFNNNPNMTGVTFPATMYYGAQGTNGNGLYYMYLDNCDLTGNLDLSMWERVHTTANIRVNDNPNLTSLTLYTGGYTAANSWSSNTHIATLYADGCSLGVTDLTGQWGEGASTTVRLEDNGMTAAEVNETLDILATYLSTLTTTSGYLSINGTNAAVDTTSGGFDGVAAKAAIIAAGVSCATT